MRHKVYGRRLGRDTSHREALRKNMVADLICHEEIVTTEAKARMLRPTAEKLITLAKRGIANGKENPSATVHARRLVAARVARFRRVQREGGGFDDVDVVQKLFNEIAPRYESRPGGYTRIVKMNLRPGDNAKMAKIMLVENE
jgi:large subunit ribosomal protein L17